MLAEPLLASSFQGEMPTSASSASGSGVSGIPALVANVRKAYNTHKTHDVAWRKQQLKAICKLVEENTSRIVDALKSDLGRPEFEGVVLEVSPWG